MDIDYEKWYEGAEIHTIWLFNDYICVCFQTPPPPT